MAETQRNDRDSTRGNPKKAGVRLSGWKASGKRIWVLRLAVLFLSTVVCFGLLELVLRLVGYGEPTAFFLPNRIKNREVFTENPRFEWQFFPPALARAPHSCVMPA